MKLIDADEPLDKYRGDYFVAIHGDGNSVSSVNGASVGYQNSNGQVFARKWKAAYEDNGWSRNWKADNYTANLKGYYGVKNAIAVGNRNAIIIEVGFMTNPQDRAWIDKNHKAIAKSIWDAVAGKEQPVSTESYDWIDTDVVSPGPRDSLLAFSQRNSIKFIVRAGSNGRALVSLHVARAKKSVTLAEIQKQGGKDTIVRPGRQDNSVRRWNARTDVTL